MPGTLRSIIPYNLTGRIQLNEKARILFENGLAESLSQAKRMVIQIPEEDLNKLLNELKAESDLHDRAIDDYIERKNKDA